MDDLRQAVVCLRQHLGYPAWLSAIGAGEENGSPLIVLYTVVQCQVESILPSGTWMGFPVKCVLFGTFAPLGQVTNG